MQNVYQNIILYEIVFPLIYNNDICFNMSDLSQNGRDETKHNKIFHSCLDCNKK